ncbi:phospholipid scramblase [Pseudoscourfieldia marina]
MPASVPVSDVYGTFVDGMMSCISYKVSASVCGSENLCVCMYCAGCPFWGWDMCFLGNSPERGDCYLGCSGSSMFVLRVKDKDTVLPNDCCVTATRVPDGQAMSR